MLSPSEEVCPGTGLSAGRAQTVVQTSGVGRFSETCVGAGLASGEAQPVMLTSGAEAAAWARIVTTAQAPAAAGKEEIGVVGHGTSSMSGRALLFEEAKDGG